MAADQQTRELEQLRAENASLMQLLDVHERAVLVKSKELERAHRALDLRARELERSNRDLDQFAYVVSHDLKAPLRAIVNLTEWLEEDLGGSLTGKSRELMDLLKGRVTRMQSMIQGILTYSRIGRMQHSIIDVEVEGLVREAIDLVAPPEGYSVEIVSPLPNVTTDPHQLRQVFLNLMSNAVKYNDSPEPRVWIGGREDGDFHEYFVSDNGSGIEPQFREKIWELFQTLQARDEVESTGIGLAVVKKIVERQGGRLWMDDDGPGTGATFHFQWPKETKDQGADP